MPPSEPKQSSPGARAAFFDLDLTILRIDSAITWMRFLRARRELSALGMARAAYWSLLYKFALLDMDTLADRMAATLRATSEAVMVAKAREFYDHHIAHHVAPAALAAVERHRAQGDRVVLLSATTQYLATIIGSALRLDDVLCSRVEVQDGTFTGGIAVRCFGRHKVPVAERFAAEAGVDLRRSTFYSDSYNDLPMLLRVGEPVAVNPDARLRRHARKYGWRIERWARS